MNESINSYVSGLSAAQLDGTIAELLSTKRRCEWLVCRYLADIADDKRFLQVGYYSDVFHYAKERLKLGVKLTRERIRIGKALRDVPRIEGAFVGGDLSYSKVREITRVAGAEDEDQWLELALSSSTREVERAVAGRLGGKEAADERPANVRWRTPETVEVNMVLPADTWALLKRAAQGVRLSADGPMSDAETVGAVVMEALNSLTSAGKGAHAADPRKAVVLYHCVDCSRSELETNAGAVPLTPAAAERLSCGAKVVDLDTEGWGQSFGGEIPAPVRRAVLARDRGRCRCCGRRRYVEVHHLTPRSDGGAHSRAGCASLCSACHAAVHEGKLRVEGDAESGLVFFDDRGNELADHLAGGSAAAKGAKPSTSEAPPAATPRMSEEAAAVLAAMGRRGGWHADHLADATQLPVRTVNRALLELQLSGLAHQDYLFRWLPAGGSLFGIAVEDDEPAQSHASGDAPIGTSSTAAGPVTATEPAARAVSEEAATVLAAMSGRGGWHADHLTDTTQLPFRVVNRALLELQLAGLVGQDYRFLWVPAGT